MAVCEVLPRGGANVVISETVFAVGWDEHFIIAKQHRFLGGEILRDTTNYYLLRVGDGSVWGPLVESEFEQKRKSLGVSDGLAFSLVFDDLQ